MTDPNVETMAKRYRELAAERVGSFRRESIPSLRSSADFLLSRFERARCDSDGVSDCVRCNCVYLARLILEALEGEKSPSEIQADERRAATNGEREGKG